MTINDPPFVLDKKEILMNSDRWQKIEFLFEEALKLDSSERENYLFKESGDDKEIFDEVISLLREDSNIHTILREDLSGPAKLSDSINYEGKVIGTYKIIQKIATGGMGSVFLAERADGQFEQKVALKLIKAGLNSLEIIKRFQYERQILARLQHPNIARLLDGGLTDEGLPYFTMEYVEGEPIDKYCNTHNLSIDERLKLFLKVCSAIHYAHRNLVIHRDLKPGNILITKDGNVKLLDFGIAKVFTEDEDVEQTMMTRTGLFVMTPEYASPEQIRGEVITTATDVYSLGLILYQLLTGSFPYEIKSITPLELERVICHTNPDKPSTLVTKTFKTAVEKDSNKIFEQRNIDAVKLRKKLLGDLDNICLMALRKEPERRYSSAEQFKNDIEKYLEGLPVIAHPPTIKYRTSKFIQRHKAGLTAGALALILISFLTTFYFIQLKEERDRAQLEATKSAKVSEFLQNIFEVSDPSESRGQNITARELLDRGATKIEAELKDQPDVKATMQEVIGRVYTKLGLYNEAEPMIENSLKIRSELFGAKSIESSKSLTALGILSNLQGNYEKAEELLTEAINIQKDLLPENELEKGKALNELATNYSITGKFDKSDSLYKKVIELYYKNNIKENETLFTVMNNLALSMHESGNFDEADSLFRLAYNHQKKFYDNKPHPELATTTYNYAQLLRDRGNLDEAEKMFKESLEMDKILNGPEHPDVAYSLQGLASIYRTTGKYSESEKLYRESLQIRRKLLGDEHPDVGHSLTNFGLLLIAMKNYDEAEKIFNEALNIQLKNLGEEHRSVTNIYERLGAVYLGKGELKKAERLYNKALSINKKILGENHFATASDFINLSKVKSAMKDFESAIVLCKKGIELAETVEGKESAFLTGTYSILAKIYLEKGDFKTSDSLYRISINMFEKIYGRNYIRTAMTMVNFSYLLLKMDSVRQAYNYAMEGIKILQGNREFEPVNIASSESIVGEILTTMRNYDQAEKMLIKSYSSLNKELGNNNKLTKESLKRLVNLYKVWGKNEEMIKYQLIAASP
jgi:serine/threonine-protein kinase